jgi:hypothetical protein
VVGLGMSLRKPCEKHSWLEGRSVLSVQLDFRPVPGLNLKLEFWLGLGLDLVQNRVFDLGNGVSITHVAHL